MRLLTLLIGAALSCLGCGEQPTLAVHSTNQDNQDNDANSALIEWGNPNVAKDKQAIKAAAKYAAEWMEFEYADHKFLCGLSEYPTFGNSHLSVECWVFRDFSGEWERLLDSHCHGLGAGKMIFSEQSGVFELQGRANNQFRGKSVVTLDLNAAVD